jgi:hypothetical protein
MNIINGNEFLSLKNKMTPEQRRQCLFQKNLKKLGFILLDCALLQKYSMKADVYNSKEKLEIEFQKLKTLYESGTIKDDLNEDSKANMLKLISELTLKEQKKLKIKEIYKEYFYSEKQEERYTHNAFNTNNREIINM